MALPLPRTVADVGPGGPLVTSMGGINALANNMFLKKINQVKAEYAPLTTKADAASKLAYANLMGPQFLAKLMGNDSALANMTEDQKAEALKKLYQAGTGQGTGMNALNDIPQMSGVGQPSTNSFSGWALDKLKNAFGATPQKNAMAMGGSASNPGQYNAPPEYASPPPSRQMANPQGAPDAGRGHPEYAPNRDSDATRAIDQAYQEWVQTPEGQAEVNKGVSANIPTQQAILEWKRQRDAGQPGMQLELNQGNAPRKTYAENTGEYKGVVKEGEEAGKIRANDIKELNDVVFNADTKLATLNDINDMIASPEMREIRQLPLAGSHELSWYAKEGTPEQQQLVGRIRSQLGNVIKDASRDFAGQFRKGEQQLLSGMKANDSDTIDTMIGKQESLTTMAKMLRERAALTSKYMNDNHINKLQAQDMADKQVNGEAIRKQVHDKLNPTVTIRNRVTGEKRTISVAEARKLGVPNV